MRRLPIVPTLIVLAAVATMIALGFWQIRRAHWKEGLLAQYRAAEGAPLIEGLPAGGDLSFRRAHLACTIATPPIQLGGPNAAGTMGFRNITGCRLGDGRTLMVDLGWAAINVRPTLPESGSRIEATGRLIPDDVLARRQPASAGPVLPLVLVAETPAPTLQPSVAASIENVPNNHRGYAVQWFLFAATATIIYAIAVLRRKSPSKRAG